MADKIGTATGENPLPNGTGAHEKVGFAYVAPSLATWFSAGIGIALLTSSAARADDFQDARLLASQCAQCHGTNGAPTGDIDSLAGSEFRDLRDKMLDMSRPGETGDIMKHQAKGYTPEQIDLIAWYYAMLPKPEDREDEDEHEEDEKKKKRGKRR